MKARLKDEISVVELPDPRVQAVSVGEPVLIHPLRIPNTRAVVTPSLEASLFSLTFARIAGLIHKMILVRDGVDDIDIDPFSTVLGRVPVHFDISGYEFEHECWVVDDDLMRDAEMILGADWLQRFKVQASFDPRFMIVSADAKRARKLEDVYVTD